MRPPRSCAPEAPAQRTYAEWLGCAGHEVRTVAASGILITEAFATLDDDVIAWFPEVVVINFGIVETCHRQTIRAVNNRVVRNYYLNRVFNRPYRFPGRWAAATDFFWRMLNGATRRVAAMLGLHWQWLSTDRFLRALEDTIRVILKETSARVIVVAISPCSPRVERVLAGSGRAIAQANEAMQALVTRLGHRVAYLSPAEMLAGGSAEDLVPDGIHFSADGHRRVARALEARLASSS